MFPGPPGAPRTRLTGGSSVFIYIKVRFLPSSALTGCSRGATKIIRAIGSPGDSGWSRRSWTRSGLFLGGKHRIRTAQGTG